MVAEEQREGEKTPRLDLVLVGADGSELGAQILHAAVVDAPQSLGHRRIVPRPVAHGEVDGQQLIAERECAGASCLRPGIAAPAFDALENLVRGPPFPAG